ncbi:MAG TPA: DUF1800 domain-containing protein [Sphingomonas sp.]|nr:DUF1800 domain-containing protein [Sphingomonas sp.]
MTDLSIALNRFGLGARGDEPTPTNARRWLMDQLDRFDPKPAALAALPDHNAVFAAVQKYNVALRQERLEAQAEAKAAGKAGAAKRKIRQTVRQKVRDPRDFYFEGIGARLNTALMSSTPFVERLVHFWSNHFAISAEKLPVTALAAAYETEAIRPHVLGRFSDLLNAVERHPAMLYFLDQSQSVGPNSRAVVARGGVKGPEGLNENLGREVMELHTLGVRTGYTQADVTEFARALTGWTVLSRPAAARAGGNAKAGDFGFSVAVHEPGVRTIMGKRYPQQGEAQAQAVLDDLAVHPMTAKHIATKLARHFVADSPPPSLVAKLETAFRKSGGDLPTVYRALIDAPEAWTSRATKFKSPWEWTLSALRAIGTRDMPARSSAGLIQQLGQTVWRPGSPAGFDDVAGAWAGPDAVFRRVQAAARMTRRRADADEDARVLAPRLFPGSVAESTTQVLARAESPEQALALLLVAPEMMRR